MGEEIKTHPVQTVDHRGGRISTVVTIRVYEAYKHIFGAQEAMITGSCRGGFSTGELICFLYARSFPQNEWRIRFDEAMTGSVHI